MKMDTYNPFDPTCTRHSCVLFINYIPCVRKIPLLQTSSFSAALTYSKSPVNMLLPKNYNYVALLFAAFQNTLHV